MPENNRLLTLAAACTSMATADGIQFDETIHLTFNARTVHHDDPDFPVVAPDMWHSNLVSEDKDRRRRYHQGMKSQRAGRRNTWKANCKHFVPGALYQDIVNRFYVIPMDGLNKYRLNVSVRDQHRAHNSWLYVNFAHSPLRKTCKTHKRGLGNFLYENAIAIDINNHDCHQGLNLGAMAVS